MNLTDFFFNTPIYTPVIVEAKDQDLLRELFGEHVKDFDGYNPNTKLDSTFRLITNLLRYNDSYLEDGGFNTLQVKCKRSDNVFQYYILWNPRKNTLLKVGQYPSVADFHISEIKEYSKLLPKEKLKEFTRAIGLAANGVGIGSYVYLRRIFEYLIYEAYEKAIAESAINEGDFQRSRMDEKIDLLHSYLPTFLIENKGMYSILSLGIHELDDDTCLAHFDTLRVGIEIILDEKLEEFKRNEKMELAKQKLAQLKQNIKK